MNKIKWTFILSLVSLIFIVAFTSCDFNNISNPADKLEVRIKNIARETFVSFEVKDAKSGNLITTPIYAEIKGTGAGLVISEVNEPTTNFEIENGILLFAIADGITPSTSDPVKLNIILRSDNYLSTSQPIVVTKDGMNTFSALMTDLDNTPTGVVSNQENAGETGDDGMDENIEISSGTDDESGGAASIAIAQGTKLKDEAGNVLSGTVEATVTYFNPLNEESKAAFPGGFSVTTDDDEEGSFTTAGFVAIDMTVGGQEVEQFDSGVDINIDVPEGTINPETGQPVQPGDNIPVYSYDEKIGEWTYEGEVTVPEQDALGKSNGTHRVTINNVTHLSWWNLDWFDGDRCYEYPTLIFESTTGTFDRVFVKICKQGAHNPVSWWSSKTVYASDAEKSLYGFPANGGPVTVRVYSAYNTTTEIGSFDISNLCTNETFTIPFTDTVELINISLTVQIKCDDAGVTPDGLPIYARSASDGNWINLGRIGNGTVSGTFIADEYYDFAIYFDGQWYFTNQYADDILQYADESGYTMHQNGDGYLQMEASNTDITILLNNIDSICDEF